MPELWRSMVDWMRSFPSTSAPGGMDRPRVRALLWELYLLGERPTPTEIRKHGGVNGLPTPWSRSVAALWRERLNDPARRTLSREGARNTFDVPAMLLADDPVSIEARLARELARVAGEYAASITAAVDAKELLRLDQIFELQARALSLRGHRVAFRLENAGAEIPVTRLHRRRGQRLANVQSLPQLPNARS